MAGKFHHPEWGNAARGAVAGSLGVYSARTMTSARTFIQRIGGRAWLIVGVLWLVALLNYLDRQLVTTMGRPIKVELGIGDAQFGLFSSAFLWVYGLLSPLAG